MLAWPGSVVHGNIMGTGEWAVMPCGWEGNRKFDVALTMRHRDVHRL